MTIRYFSSYSRITRTELSARTLEQIQREFGARVEPFTLHLPLPELLAGSWMACRESVSRAVGAWDGKDPGPGSAWIGRILGEYSGASKAAGELALLAALAPYRITSAEVSVFSNHYPDDGQLLAVLAWGSFTAAKHIGRWMV